MTAFYPKVPQKTVQIFITSTKPCIHFRNLFLQFVHITLRKASEHNHLPDIPLFLTLHGLKYNTDGFLLGITYETTGIDKQTIYRRIILYNNEIICRQGSQQMFCINGVFRAPEGNHPKPLLTLHRHLQNPKKHTSRFDCTSQEPYACAKDRICPHHNQG